MATITHDCVGYRPMTSDEVDAWHAAQTTPWDSAGEPWVCDKVQRVRVPADTEVTVARARCSADIGWRSASGFSEVILPNGERVKVGRQFIREDVVQPTIRKGTGIEAKISLFAVEAGQMITQFYATQFPELKAPELKVDWGRKYAKVVKVEANGGRSVFCFVDRTNGDILKAASWAAPAKHARGSVLGENILAGVGPYGANYL